MSNTKQFIELPYELKHKKIQGPTLISWVVELELAPLMVDYHRTHAYYEEHFYWEKSQDNFSLYGILPIENPFETIITNSTKVGTGPIELSSGLFDQRTDSSINWQELSQSIHYLPSLLRTEKGRQQFITFNLVLDETYDLEKSWNELQRLWLDYLDVENESNHSIATIQEEKECHVEEWMAAVDMLKASDQISKIVLARQLEVITDESINVAEVLTNLREQQPNTYRFSVRKGAAYFVGATPERLIEATPDYFSTVCVAGSIERGKTEDEDKRFGDTLLADQKNVIEHNFVVQWLTSQMKAVTTQLDNLNQVSLLKNRDIQHLFLPIKGERKPTVTFEETIHAFHPSPALGGLPKEEAMDWIMTHEVTPRGLYGGPLGWRNLQSDTGEMVVGIRSGFISKNRALLYAGCGIVPGSIAELERKETRIKFQPMLRALGGLKNE